MESFVCFSRPLTLDNPAVDTADCKMLLGKVFCGITNVWFELRLSVVKALEFAVVEVAQFGSVEDPVKALEEQELVGTGLKQ